MCFQFGGFLHPEVTKTPSLPSLRLLVFTSRTKKEENIAPRRFVEYASRDSRNHEVFSGEIHSEHKHSVPKFNYWYYIVKLVTTSPSAKKD